MLEFFILYRKGKHLWLVFSLVAGSVCWHVLFIALTTKCGSRILMILCSARNFKIMLHSVWLQILSQAFNF